MALRTRKGSIGWVLPALAAGMLIVSACGGGGGGSSSGDVTQSFASGWVKESGTRISDPNAWNPDIVRVAGGGYRMYFERQDSLGDRNTYSAFSLDGLSWTEDNGVRIPLVNMPGAVTTAGGQVRLYYNDAGQFGSALSTDGLVFVLDGGTRVSADQADESGGIRHPCVIRLSDNSYRMFYDATDSDNVTRIKTAVSSDGLAWTKQGVVISPAQVTALGTPALDYAGTPGAVIDSGGLIRLFFSTRGPNAVSTLKGIYMATSTNGTTFTVQAGPIVSEFSSGGLDFNPQDAAPVFTAQGLRVYYWIGSSVADPLNAIYSAINASLTE